MNMNLTKDNFSRVPKKAIDDNKSKNIKGSFTLAFLLDENVDVFVRQTKVT